MTAEDLESTMHACPTCGREVAADAKVCPHDGTILSWSTVDPMIGTLLLEKYQISGVLGRGGMSAVYKARHLLMDRNVAIKVLRAELVHDPQSLRRFQLESRAVSLLKHPNVMTVHDFGLTPDGIPYLIMDYLEGKTINEILRDEGQMTPERCVELMHQACVALAHAHSKGVVHRDIKPSNMIVLIDEDGSEVLKIVDFGIAKLLQSEGSISKMTTTGEVFGSPAYMSPEQCMGTRVDARSDIYGLGCVVYECLMGSSPIRGATAMETCIKQINEMPRTFSQARPDLKLSQEFEDAVVKALAKNPDERYQSMVEFDQGLRKALGQDAVLKLKGEPEVVDEPKVKSPLSGDITETMVNPEVDTKGDTITVVAKTNKKGKDKAGAKKDTKKTSTTPAPDVVAPVKEDAESNAATADIADTGDLATKTAEKGNLSDSRTRIPPLAVPSYDLFGNQLLPAAPERINDTGAYDTARDTGAEDTSRDTAGPTFFDADKLLPSILPAAPEAITLPEPVVTTPSTGSPSTPKIESSETANKTPLIEETKKAKGLSPVSIGLIAAAVLIIGGFAVWQAMSGHAGDQNADKHGGAVSTTGGAEMSPHDVFKACTPSIVTLTIVTKALEVAVDGMELTDLSGENPVLIGPTGDGQVSLFEDGKPVDTAKGKLKTPKGTILVGIKLVNGKRPVLIPVTGEGKPFADKDGNQIMITKGVGLKEYGQEALGSGFYVRPDIVATNCHVVSMGAIGPAGFAGGLAQVTDKQGKFTIMDKPIAVDLDHDLALLYVPGSEAKPLTLLSDYSKLKVGEKVYALGSPKGLAGSISEGIISSDELRARDKDSPKTFLQHTAKIDHGNSGGPLVDGQGQVVGINTAYAGNGAINLAVVSHFIDDLLDKPEVKAKIDDFAKKSETDLHG